MDNFTWYETADLREYAGKWIAIHHEHVAAADEDLKVVLDKTEKEEDVLVVHIPDPKILYIHNAQICV